MKSLKFFITTIIALFIAVNVYAADTDIKQFDFSATTITGTGLGDRSEAQGVTIGEKDGKKCVIVDGSKSPGNAYWEDVEANRPQGGVYQLKIHIPSLDQKYLLYMKERTSWIDDYFFKLEGASLTLGETVHTLTTDDLGWYTLTVLLDYENKILVYMEPLIESQTDTRTNGFKGEMTSNIGSPTASASTYKFILYFDAENSGSILYFTDFKAFIPSDITYSLTTDGTTPVPDGYENPPSDLVVSFSRPLTSLAASQIEVGEVGGNTFDSVSYSFIKNSLNHVTSVKLTFPDGTLIKGKSYYVSFNGCKGALGEGLAEPAQGSDVFSILPEEFDYSFDDISVYKGINKTPITAMQTGMITVSTTVKNAGRQERNIVFVYELKDTNGNIVSKTELTRLLGKNGAKVTADFGMHLKNIANTELHLTLKDTDGNVITTVAGAEMKKIGGELFE